MLEGLLAQLPLPPNIAVPPVPSLKNHREPLQPMDYGAVPLVPPVPPQKTETKTKNEIITYSFDDRHYCHECSNLINKRCIVQRFRPVDDRPRRCSDYIGRS